MTADRFPRRLAVLFVFLAPLLLAGPRDFGRAELDRVIQERGWKLRISDAIVAGPSETYTITPTGITGGDERGLMYCLLAAAAQLRADRSITAADGAPSTATRGIRDFIQ